MLLFLKLFAKKGGHASELSLADYVIVGAFSDEVIAMRYSEGLKKLKFEVQIK